MNTDRERNEGVFKNKIKIFQLRRFVTLGIIFLFLLQFLRIKVLVGGLSGSISLWVLKLIDVFAYFESLIASRDFSKEAFLSLLPVIAIYSVFGRAFCGWVCPMDFLFEMISSSRAGRLNSRAVKISPASGYIIAGILLGVSALLGIPFFTNYISHLTNFFRLITGSVFYLSGLPVEGTVIIYSALVIFFLLTLEYFFPRLWCRVICPVGKVYGVFNRFSLIRLRFIEGQCARCYYCEEVCYMNIKLTAFHEQNSLRDTNCIYCGRCVEACSTKERLIKIVFRR
ncbi:MAG: 4Fe-4S binding protein [Thermodesulfovibrionales bacterium]|nr:4Fe-4S binding protein [Thermodesulfovibrionales bacterium]